MAPKTAPPRKPRKTKVILLYVAANLLVVPVLFLLLLELTLRLIGYGYPGHFFVRQDIDGKPCYVTNFKFTWRFFPKPMARLPAPLVVPAEKAPGVLRVFVLGSSAAQGDPDPSFSFSRFLEVMLRDRFPGKKIEIYNTAATAINSNVILPIARDCLELKPDLFIIYSGNNEVIGPYGLSETLSPFFSSRTAIKSRVWIGQTKIGQLGHALSQNKKQQAADWHGMGLFVQNKVRHSDPTLETIYSHFEDNIAEICQLARNSGIKVLLSTVVVNDLDCAPFVSLHRPDLDQAGLDSWESLFAQGQKSETNALWSQAVESYSKAVALDPDYAELEFRLGRCLLQLGRTNDAAQCLAKARDYDALRFRADTRINEAIRKIAANSGGTVTLVDADARARQTVGIPGEDILLEHVHFNFNGNYFLADTMLPSTEKLLGLQASAPVPTLERCKVALAYTPLGEKRIYDNILMRLTAAPFAGRYSNAGEIKRVQERSTANSALVKTAPEPMDRAFREAIAVDPADWALHFNYMDFLVEKERYPEACREAEATYKLIPFEYLSLVNMGITLTKSKRYDEAAQWLNRAVEQNPYFTRAYEAQATIFEDQKQFAKALELLEKARISPEKMAGFYNRAGIACANDKQFDAAIDYFKNALRIRPEFPEAQANLQKCENRSATGGADASISQSVTDEFNHANQLLKSADYTNAIELYKKVLEVQPNHPKAHNNLGLCYVKLKQLDDALEQFNKGISIDPKSMESYLNAAGVLGMSNRHQEAVDMLKKALEIKPSAQIYDFLAREYTKLGDNDAAQHCREQSKQLQKK